jgi:hypothetical protein
MRTDRTLYCLIAVALTSDVAAAQVRTTPEAEPYLKLSYGLALGKCSGTLVLHPDGRFKASASFGGKDLKRSGKIDRVYWDLAVDTLKDYGLKSVESVDIYYNTIPPDAPNAEARAAELQAKTDYVILDGHAFTLDWRDKYGEREYLYDAHSHSPSTSMWKKLFRVVRFEKMTCGHYFQQIFWPR